jgi:hypothetical protein
MLCLPVSNSTNPFLSRGQAPTPKKGASTDESLTSLREGMGRMDIASRSGSADISSNSTLRDGRDLSSRDVSCWKA